MRFTFAYKLTNWCNMNCRHCCENSGTNEPYDLIPLEKIDGYLSDFKKLDLPHFEHIVFTGGETMAAYYSGDYNYVPRCLGISFKNQLTPFFKTNGLWGGDTALRSRILSDFSHAALQNGKLTTFDISMDEFHNNLDQVATIVSHVAQFPVLSNTVRLCLLGLSTPESKVNFNHFKHILGKKGLVILKQTPDYIQVAHSQARHMVDIPIEFDAGVVNHGRAADNNMGKYTFKDSIDPLYSCIMIDNKDVLFLDYIWRESLKTNSFPMALMKTVKQKSLSYR